ncbi:MAG: hypothetical protein LBG77_02390, partial [Dysgonamonadaceae bacterium]|nr:hypothetical protein [Dysgonamonadaceae bacterium]
MTKKIYVYWWGHGNDTFSNFGDALNPVLIENLSGMNVAKAACSKISTLLMMKKVFGLVAKRNSWDELKLTFYGWTARKIIFAVGSVIQWNGHKKSIIWGSGLLYRDAYPQKCQVRAVRGPFTRERLLELGFDVPPVYGDPA